MRWERNPACRCLREEHPAEGAAPAKALGSSRSEKQQGDGEAGGWGGVGWKQHIEGSGGGGGQGGVQLGMWDLAERVVRSRRWVLTRAGVGWAVVYT